MTRHGMIAAALLLGLMTSSAVARIWSSASGTFKVDAELAEARADGTLVLKRPGGQLVEVPLHRLSQADQDFVRQQSSPPPHREDTPAPTALDKTSPAATRRSLPDAKEVAKKVSELRDLLSDDYQKAQTNDEGRQEFLNKLTQLANESLTKDPAGAFAAVSLAADAASTCGDLTEALARLNWLEERFQIVDGPARRVNLAGRTRIDSLSAAMAAANTIQLLSILEEREDAADYEGATEIGRLALRTARQANEPKNAARIAARGRKLKDQKEIYEAVAASVATLKTKPQDAAANLMLGKFLCLVRGKWEQGLPHLAAGEDTELAPVAKRDLGRPTSTADESELADKWWALSELPKYRGYAEELTHRSAFWYSLALPQLSGLDKLRAEKRIKAASPQAVALVAEDPPQPSGPKSKPVREPKSSGAGGWLVLFRSGDPAVWDSDSKQINQYAIPLNKVPDDVKFLKLKRMDSNAAVIIPMTKGRLNTQFEGDRLGWNGTKHFEWKACHLGVFNKQWKTSDVRGPISIAYQTDRDFAGWGFGHKANVDDRQYCAWAGQEIKPTIFEISVTFRLLSKADESLLLR